MVFTSKLYMYLNRKVSYILFLTKYYSLINYVKLIINKDLKHFIFKN